MASKYALIIANTEYSDPNLAQLSAPSKDAEDFARVLRDKEIAGFDDVKVILNHPESYVRERIDEFFDSKKTDDLLLLYFSGHGVRDEMGSLYLALRNTSRARLRATALRSDFIREAMDQSRSKRIVLILDCCNSGAFAHGTKAVTGGSVGTASAFEGTGYGRIVLTASDSTQFAWEGDKVIGGDTQNSLFTHFLIKGLEGEADRDSDGRITVDELYDFAYEQIVTQSVKQTPGKWSYQQKGEIVLRDNIPAKSIKPVKLPDELLEAIEDSRSYVRESAVGQLEKFLNGKNLGLARSARELLEKIAKEDDSRNVAELAKRILTANNQAEQKQNVVVEVVEITPEIQEAPKKLPVQDEIFNRPEITEPKLPVYQPPKIVVSPPVKSKSWLRISMDALFKPSQQSYAEILSNPAVSTVSVYLWLLVVGTITSIFSSLSQLLYQAFGWSMFGVELIKPIALNSTLVITSLVVSLIMSPIGGITFIITFTVLIALYNWTARLFKGSGTFTTNLYGIATIMIPVSIISILLMPFYAIPYVNVFVLIFSFILSGYFFYLQAMMIKVANKLGWGQAIGTLLVPVFASLLLTACILLVFFWFFGDAILQSLGA